MAKLVFDELFKIISELTKQTGTELKVDNIVVAIDTFDNQLPQLLIDNSKDPASDVIKRYYNIRKVSFEDCFKRIRHSFDLVVEAQSRSFLKELEGVLLVLAKISKICYYQDYVYSLLYYLWSVYLDYGDDHDIKLCVLQTLSLVCDRTLLFLLVTDDPERPKEPIDQDQERAIFVANIFVTLKRDLICRKCEQKSIIHVLHMLDLRNRFIGQYIDAILENTLHKDGYILRSNQTTAFESNDVYEAYEEFLNMS